MEEKREGCHIKQKGRMDEMAYRKMFESCEGGKNTEECRRKCRHRREQHRSLETTTYK
jgi:hypothetical protein